MPSIARQITSFKEKEISELFKKTSKRIKEQGLTILVSPKSSDKDFGRILIITPRRIGIAPKRNLIRRQLKSIFYENKLFELDKNLVIIVTKHALKLSFDDLKKILLDITGKN